MKRTILLFFATVMTTVMMAGNVTPEQALQKATQFVQARAAKGDGLRLAPGMKPQLTLAARPNGLYVYNVADNSGYVIVSPDDRTEAILGFSDSGSFDPENIPCNMQEWLQGYADEIAWLNEHPELAVSVTATPALASRSNVAPLVTAHWDQFGVYNESCPKQDNKKTLVGCMAVAMGQVMHKWKTPDAVVNGTPAYTGTAGVYVPAVPTGSPIDWSNMLERYGYYNVDGNMGGTDKGTFSDYTETQAKAVADFLFYCGASLRMNYTSSNSGSVTAYVPIGVVDNFGYDNTALAISRSYYSDDRWTEILYNELSQGRPVVYSGGSHAFVCDGYKTGDYFHFNWGFSTLGYDGYYLLSSLKPGSSDYTSSNAAAIGIQPKGIGGTVSSSVYKMNTLYLKLLDNSISQNPVRPGSDVTMTITFQNFYENTFSGTITLVPTYDTSSGFGWNSRVGYEDVSVASGETKTVSITFKASTSEESIRYAFIYKDNGKNKCLIRFDPLVTSNSAPETGIQTIDNGQLIMDDVYYDLSGRKVEHPTKGVYILNGKKVIVR